MKTKSLILAGAAVLLTAGSASAQSIFTPEFWFGNQRVYQPNPNLHQFPYSNSLTAPAPRYYGRDYVFAYGGVGQPVVTGTIPGDEVFTGSIAPRTVVVQRQARMSRAEARRLARAERRAAIREARAERRARAQFGRDVFVTGSVRPAAGWRNPNLQEVWDDSLTTGEIWADSSRFNRAPRYRVQSGVVYSRNSYWPYQGGNPNIDQGIGADVTYGPRGYFGY